MVTQRVELVKIHQHGFQNNRANVKLLVNLTELIQIGHSSLTEVELCMKHLILPLFETDAFPQSRRCQLSGSSGFLNPNAACLCTVTSNMDWTQVLGNTSSIGEAVLYRFDLFV